MIHKIKTVIKETDFTSKPACYAYSMVGLLFGPMLFYFQELSGFLLFMAGVFTLLETLTRPDKK